MEGEVYEYIARGGEDAKPVTLGSAVNVIYFTNKCNLACTYCYEDLANRPPQIMGKEDIRKSVDAVLERETDPTKQTLFVLFGGEVTLEWDNVLYLMEYAYSKKKNVHFNLETNGIKFLSDKFLLSVINNKFYKENFMSIDVSFDGIGNSERIFHDGTDSTASMIKILSRLAANNVRYRIRYTIQASNVEHCRSDITRLINTFKPDRVITSVAWSDLSDEQLASLKTVKEQMRDDWRAGRVSKPVCEFFCDMCNGCGERKELKTYFTDEGNVTTYGNYFNAPKFHDFKEKNEQ